jgi:REP-associated tyrosine transposase
MRCSMPRRARIAPGEIIYHALNHAKGRSQLFDKPDDYAAFERIMVAAMRRSPIRLLAYCLMPTHWHMVLWPEQEGETTEFLCWFTLTHSQRLHAHHRTAGCGHIYQGRLKSFPVEQDQAALSDPLCGTQPLAIPSRLQITAAHRMAPKLGRHRSRLISD